MKTITTLFILLCGITFSNAQSKQLPNKEETKNYLENMVLEADGKEYISNAGYTYEYSLCCYPSFVKNSFADNLDYTYIQTWGRKTVISCTIFGIYRENEVSTKDSYSNYDFRKLKDVRVSSKIVSNATALQVSLVFEDANINNETEYMHGLHCDESPRTSKTNVVFMCIPNEEGSFDRFKKALFHYKDLLIAEQKQKLADDPFGN